MAAAVFLDRDGTLIKDYGYNHRPQDQLEFLPGTLEALRSLQGGGYRLVVITNQSGIGRGKYSDSQYQDFARAMETKLAEGGVRLTATYYCPHAPEDGCDCRKPSPSLIFQAAAEHDVALGESFMVGDKDDDVQAGKAAGCRTVRIASGQYHQGEKADVSVSTLAEFANQLLAKP